MCCVCGRGEHRNGSLRPLRRRRLVVRPQQGKALGRTRDMQQEVLEIAKSAVSSTILGTFPLTCVFRIPKSLEPLIPQGSNRKSPSKSSIFSTNSRQKPVSKSSAPCIKPARRGRIRARNCYNLVPVLFLYLLFNSLARNNVRRAGVCCETDRRSPRRAHGKGPG